jgi:hypothetical protein
MKRLEGKGEKAQRKEMMGTRKGWAMEGQRVVFLPPLE